MMVSLRQDYTAVTGNDVSSVADPDPDLLVGSVSGPFWSDPDPDPGPNI
jgi:hypothetical protein